MTFFLWPQRDFLWAPLTLAKVSVLTRVDPIHTSQKACIFTLHTHLHIQTFLWSPFCYVAAVGAAMWMRSSGSRTAHELICWSTQHAEDVMATRTYKQQLKVCNSSSVTGCIALRPLLSNIWPHTCCPGTILQLRHMANILYVNKQKLTHTHTN